MSQDTHAGASKLRTVPWFYWLLLISGLLLLSMVLLLPSVGSRSASGRSRCVNNLKQIGIALMMYHDQHKSYPPAVVNDEHGVPMHSWRAILLPYFEDEGLQKLGKQYRFEEPWNGPNNRKLLQKAPAIFRCPNDSNSQGEASYLAVIGGETMWPGTKPMRIREIDDGIHKTIAVVECSDSGINWLEPRDLTFNDGAAGINKLTGRPGIRSFHTGGANTLFADGSVHFLYDDIKPDILRGLLTPAGGENAEIPE